MVNDKKGQHIPHEMRETIEKLEMKFRDSLVTRILNIDKVLSASRGGGQQLPSAKYLIDATHSIAGLAPCLGFDRLGDLASRAEQLWEQAIEQDFAATVFDAAIDATDMLLDEMEATLEPVRAASA